MVKPDRERYVWLYCRSVQDKERYQALAEEAGAPLSKFILGVFEDALAAAKDNEGTGPSTIKELQTLREENKRLKEDLRLRELLINKLEAENQRFKAATWADEFEGFRDYDSELVGVLKTYGPVHTGKLLERLNIEPNDVDRIEGLSKQLEGLEAHGIIKHNAKGWMWCK